MKIYLDNNLGVEKVEQEELTQDTIGYNILKVYIPNAVLTPYDTFTCYYGALLQNGRKVGWFAMEARTSTDADYEANYTLYKATLEQCIVSVEGKVYIGCQVLLGNSGNATLIKKNTAVVQFNVRKSVAINNDILILDTDQTTTDVLESYKNLLENALTTYATKAEVYTKTQVDALLLQKADKSDTYTKAQVDNRLSLKADKSDTYTKTEVDVKEQELYTKLSNVVDLLDLLQIGCHCVPTLNERKIQKNNTRAGFPYVIKIDKDDVIYVNTTNSNLALDIFLIPLDYGTVTTILSAWNTKKIQSISGYEGYLLVNCGYFSDKTQTITSLEDLIDGAIVKIYSKEEKKIIKYTYGISYAGNMNGVSQSDTAGASQSDFIPVKEGEIYRISFLMSGKISNSNASGITCFTEATLSSFVGFLAETDLITESVPSSQYLYVKDWIFAIPKGVNYISITARNNGLNNVTSATLSSNEAFYSVFNSFEKIGNIENFSHESIDWVFGNPLGNDGVETTGDGVWKTPLFRIPKNSQIYFPKQTFNNWTGMFFDVYYYDKLSNFIRKETNRKIIFAEEDLYVRLVLKNTHGSSLHLVQYLKENKQSNVSAYLASLTNIGDCIAIKNNDTDKTILIDTGMEDKGLQCLMSIGVNEIEALIITHYHKDHANLLSTLLNQPNLDFSNTLFFLPPTPPQEYLDGDYPNDFDTSLYNSIQTLLSGNEYQGRVFKIDDLLYHTYFTDCGKIEFLNYDQSYLQVGTHYNNYSIVQKLTIDDYGKTMLFTGDIEQEAQNHIKDICGHIDVLKTPHHGFTGIGGNAIYNTSQDWLDNISADLFVSSSPSNIDNRFYLDSAIIKYANVNNINNVMTGKVGIVEIDFKNGNYTCKSQSYYCPITNYDFTLIKYRN